MTRKDKFRCEGEVIKLLPNANFSIKLSAGHIVTAYASGRMRKAKVKVLLGDRVEVEMGVYDNTKGIVVHRYTKSQQQDATAVSMQRSEGNDETKA